jgi:DUF4097 and DUF4098 domain-containing protein YvlB
MRNTTAIFVILALAVTAPALAQRKIDEVRPLAPDGEVWIENLAGSVQVIGSSTNQVEITGVLGKNVRDLEISGSEYELEIYVDVPSHVDDLETDLVIHIPATASVVVDTVSATIQVEGVAGAVELESVSGWVKTMGVPRELSVETVSGDIGVASAPTSTDLASVSGSITVDDAQGELYAESVSGSINVKGGALDSGDFETVSGEITFAADVRGSGSLDFESMSGSIALMVSPGVSADFDISTFSGDIVNTIGPEARRTSQYTPEKELSFTAGSGTANVSIETFSGQVKIQSR